MAVEITDVFELQATNMDPSQEYVLANDIDASDTINWNGGAGFQPVNIERTFDGQDYAISNLYVNRPSGSASLIGWADADIINVRMVNPNLTGRTVGAVCATSEWGVSNCHVSGGQLTAVGTFGSAGGIAGGGWGVSNCTVTDTTIEAEGVDAGGVIAMGQGTIINNSVSSTVTVAGVRAVGGIAGSLDGSVEYCTSEASVTGTNNGSTPAFVGGLVGSAMGTVRYSCCTGNVTANGNAVGGLIGQADLGDVEQCWASGNVVNTRAAGASPSTGGLVGITYWARVRNCYATGEVSGNSLGGGLIGSTQDAPPDNQITNCYATGDVFTPTSGGVSGSYASSGTATDSYYLNSAVPGSDEQASGYTDSQFRDPGNFSSWDSSTVWLLETGEYPVLREAPPVSNELDPPTELQVVSTRGTEFSASWNAVVGAESYRMEVSTLSDFSGIVYQSNTSATTRTATGLESDTNYYWRVRAEGSGYDPSEWSVFSDTVTTEPALDTPDNLSISDVSGKKFSISWDPVLVDGTVVYEWQVSEDSDFSNTTSSGNVEGTSVIVTNLDSGVGYYWRVRATASGYENSDWADWGSEVVTLYLEPPEAFDPTGVTDFVFTASWSSVQYATQYQLQVSLISNFSSTVTDRLLTGNSREVVGLSQDTTYYYRVRALADPTEFDASDWSNTVSVDTLAEIGPLDVPTNLSSSDIKRYSAQGNWDGVDNATRYRYQLSANPDFSNAPITGTTSSTSVTLTGTANSPLQASTVYYWRVRAEAPTKGLESSPWSSSSTFTTLADPAIEEPEISPPQEDIEVIWKEPPPVEPPAPTVTITLDGYKITKSITGYGPWEVIIENTGNSTPTFTDPDVQPWGVYYYQIIPIYRRDESTSDGVITSYFEGEVTEVTASTNALMPAKNLVVTDKGYTRISLEWDEPE